MLLPTFSISSVLVALIASTLPITVSAQSLDRDNDALGFQLGETTLFPSVRVDYLQNNNAFLQSDNVVSASEVMISPELTWVADRRLVELEGSYSGNYNLSSEEALSFVDHLFGLNANAELSSRNRVVGELLVDIGHEELGVNFTSGQAASDSDEVTYIDTQAEGRILYGANQAKGNFSVGMFVQNLDYTSRSDVTAGRGYARLEPFAEFSLRLSGDTRLLTQIRFSTFRFGDELRDRNDLSLLAGMQFNATGKTGGTFRLGVVQSQRTLSDADDQVEFVVRGSAFWEPAPFARLELDGWRELDNRGSSIATFNDLSSIEEYIRLRWLHTWASRVSHIATIQSRILTQGCPDLSTDSLLASFELNVQVTRWLSLGFSGSNTQREVQGCDNVDSDLDYERTRIGAHLRATL